MNEITLLRLSDLLPGDILLYRFTKPDRTAQRISEVTGSPYTHAAVHLGNNKIAESVVPDGVTISNLKDSMNGSLCVGVIRTQMGFGSSRQKRLSDFVASVIAQKLPFHRNALIHFQENSKAFFDNQLEKIRQNYGSFATPEDLAAKAYFCSGFITACYEAVGIIDETAQVAYPPEFFSPAHLYEHNTFGWLLGYLLPLGSAEPIPLDDPLRSATNWNNNLDIKWWHSATDLSSS